MPIDPNLIDPSLANGEWEPSAQFTLYPEGVYAARIFSVEKNEERTPGKKSYKVTWRIQGGSLDGEDVIVRHVGLYKDAIFTLYNMLAGIGLAHIYYNAENKRWIGFPTPEELQGQGCWIQIEHREFPSNAKANPDGSPVMLTSYEVTKYIHSDAQPAFLPTPKPKAKQPQANMNVPGLGQQSPFNAPQQGGFGQQQSPFGNAAPGAAAVQQQWPAATEVTQPPAPQQTPAQQNPMGGTQATPPAGSPW